MHWESRSRSAVSQIRPFSVHVPGISMRKRILSFGPFLGTLLFHSQTAGTYIRYLSFICPFLYTNTMLTSILQGLGKPGLCLIHSIAGILIRIFSVVFIIPATGIRGYFYGIFLGELLLTLLHVKALKFPYRQSANNRL